MNNSQNFVPTSLMIEVFKLDECGIFWTKNRLIDIQNVGEIFYGRHLKLLLKVCSVINSFSKKFNMYLMNFSITVCTLSGIDYILQSAFENPFYKFLAETYHWIGMMFAPFTLAKMNYVVSFCKYSLKRHFLDLVPHLGIPDNFIRPFTFS